MARSVALALLAAGLLACALPVGAAPAAAAAAAPDPLGNFKSWQEAWNALSPYKPSRTQAGAAPAAVAAAAAMLPLSSGLCCTRRQHGSRAHATCRMPCGTLYTCVQCPGALQAWTKTAPLGTTCCRPQLCRTCGRLGRASTSAATQQQW